MKVSTYNVCVVFYFINNVVLYLQCSYSCSSTPVVSIVDIISKLKVLVIVHYSWVVLFYCIAPNCHWSKIPLKSSSCPLSLKIFCCDPHIIECRSTFVKQNTLTKLTKFLTKENLELYRVVI